MCFLHKYFSKQVYNIIGEIVDIFISFALNRSTKNITKIDNDDILNELLNEIMSRDSNNNSNF